jgi:hypothetical protein
MAGVMASGGKGVLEIIAATHAGMTTDEFAVAVQEWIASAKLPQTEHGKPVLAKLPEIDFFDDREGRPIAIQSRIGRRPIAAFGNSDGDLQMLQWTMAGGGARFALFVHHDDAVFDPVQVSLRALPVSTGYFGYEHAWSRVFTTVVTYGVVNVSNLDIQPGETLHRTQRTSANLMWNPVPFVDIVVEVLAGTRVNKNGERASANQIQSGWTLKF